MKNHNSFSFVYIGALLTVMSSFIALMILSLFFGDTEIWRHQTDFVITWVILSIAPSLLFLKAFIAEKQQIFYVFFGWREKRKCHYSLVHFYFIYTISTKFSLRFEIWIR